MRSIPDNSPVLVVDDDPGLLVSVEAIFISAGLPSPALLSNSGQVMDLVEKRRFQLVILDLIMPRPDGITLLKELKTKYPDTECVIVTAVDEVAMAVKAIRMGAYDYLVKPLDKALLLAAVHRALERHALRKGLAPLKLPPLFSDLKNPGAFSDIVTQCTQMAEVFHQAQIASETTYNLLITGETGTGKELLARTIHDMGPKSKGPFKPVNMAASSNTLFEDDFFGHVKGAFTNAVGDKKGFFEAANGGTLFLDEITEMPMELQAKLLRAIEHKQIYRLGTTTPKSVDARLVTATNRDIHQTVALGKLRSDLFYRLNTIHIHLPPLRERKGDIPLLARHFLKRHARENKKKVTGFSDNFVQRLTAHDFPGNVRELENMVASAVLMEKGPLLSGESLDSSFPQTGSGPFSKPMPPPVSRVVKDHILHVLEMTGGNRTHAARILGIGIRTLRRKLKEYQAPDDPAKSADT